MGLKRTDEFRQDAVRTSALTLAMVVKTIQNYERKLLAVLLTFSYGNPNMQIRPLEL